MNRLIKPSALFALLLLISSCSKKQTNTVPTYIHVDSFVMPGSPLGTASIKTVWAYYNDQPLGVFDLPATIPVLATGKGKLTLKPGIPVDGFNNFMTAYPFLASDTSTITASPGNTLAHTPETHYFSSCNMLKIATFDTTTTKEFYVAGGTTGITINHTNQTGEINLTQTDTLSEDSSAISFTLPLGKDAYIELDYRSDIPLYIGLRADLAGVLSMHYYLAGVNPSDHWQRFYIALKDFEAQYQATSYNLFIKSSLLSGHQTGKVELDNIRLVYFY